MKKLFCLLILCILCYIVLFPFFLTATTVSGVFQRLFIYVLSFPIGIILMRFYQLLCKGISGTVLQLECTAFYLYPKLWFNGKEKYCFIGDGVFGFEAPIFYAIPKQKGKSFFVYYLTSFFSIWVIAAILLFLNNRYFLMTFLTWPIISLIFHDYYHKKGFDDYLVKCDIIEKVIQGNETTTIDNYKVEKDSDFLSTSYLFLLKNRDNIFTPDVLSKFTYHQQLRILFLLLQKSSTSNFEMSKTYYNQIFYLVCGKPEEEIFMRKAMDVFDGDKKAYVVLGLGMVREMLDMVE